MAGHNGQHATDRWHGTYGERTWLVTYARTPSTVHKATG